MKRVIVILVALGLLLSGCSGHTDADIEAARQEGYQNGYEAGLADAKSTPQSAMPAPSATPEASEAPAQESVTDYQITYQNAVCWVNSIGTVWVQVIAEITNTGTAPLYLSSGSYDLEDAAGNLIASERLVSEYPDVILPGEKGYLYDETTLDKLSEPIELVFIPRVSVEKAKIPQISLPVSDVEISDGKYGKIDVMGRIENNTTEAQSMVYIVAVMYDAEGLPICLAFTILTDDLAVGDLIGFEFSTFSLPKSVTADSVASYAVFAYPLQYQF